MYYLPVSHMFVDIRSSACLIATNLTGMIFDLQMHTFDVLSERARSKTFVRANVARKITYLKMNTPNMAYQVTILQLDKV